MKTHAYAEINDMKINFDKTSLMLFNPCRSFDFHPNILIGDKNIQLVEQTRLLGLIVSSNLKWAENTNNLVKKAYRRLWILRRLKNLGAPLTSLCDIYTKQIRCILELSVPVWNGSLTHKEINQIERVQKCALHIILGQAYSSYEDALSVLDLDSLEDRRTHLSLKFALKAEKNTKFKSWFKPNPKFGKARTQQPKYYPIKTCNERLKRGPIGYLTNLLNAHYSSC